MWDASVLVDAGEDHADDAQGDAAEWDQADVFAAGPGQQGGDDAVGRHQRRHDGGFAQGEGLGQGKGAGDGEKCGGNAQQPDAHRGGQGFEEQGGEDDQQQGHDHEAEGLTEVHRALNANGPGVETHEEIRTTPEQGGQQAHCYVHVGPCCFERGLPG